MELLSCPFCGVDVKKGAWVDKSCGCCDCGPYKDADIVECINCGVQIDYDVWNTRTLPAEVEQALEALEIFIGNSELWLPVIVDKEHEGEAIALHQFRDRALKALAACQHLRRKE